MKNYSDKILESWGQNNALYVKWCNLNNYNFYQILVLYTMNCHDIITQKRIADCNGLSKQTVSSVMKILKENNLVYLCEDSNDKRKKIVKFTEKGREYANNILKPLYQLEERVLEIIGEDKMKQMIDSINLYNLVFSQEMENLKNEKL